MTEAELTLLWPPPLTICAECGQPSARLKLVGPIVVRITAPQGFDFAPDEVETWERAFCSWECFADWTDVQAGRKKQRAWRDQ